MTIRRIGTIIIIIIFYSGVAVVAEVLCTTAEQHYRSVMFFSFGNIAANIAGARIPPETNTTANLSRQNKIILEVIV